MKTNTPTGNAFTSMLSNLRAGHAQADLSEKITELVAAVKEAGKTGTMTLKIKVAPASAGDVTKLLITDSVTMSKPEKVRPATLFFPSEDNALLRDDPNQRELNLRTLEEAPAAPLREIATTPAAPLAVAG